MSVELQNMTDWVFSQLPEGVVVETISYDNEKYNCKNMKWASVAVTLPTEIVNKDLSPIFIKLKDRLNSQIIEGDGLPVGPDIFNFYRCYWNLKGFGSVDKMKTEIAQHGPVTLLNLKLSSRLKKGNYSGSLSLLSLEELASHTDKFHMLMGYFYLIHSGNKDLYLK